MYKEEDAGGTRIVLRDIISVERLRTARRKALRRGVWFKALDGAERAIVGLTIRCVERVRSPVLARVVTAIVIKLKKAMESKVRRLVRTVGRSLAQRISWIGRNWGNGSAGEWAWDLGFARYLAITQMNTPKMFGVMAPV